MSSEHHYYGEKEDYNCSTTTYDQAMTDDQQYGEVKRDLKSRHLHMIAIGGNGSFAREKNSIFFGNTKEQIASILKHNDHY